MQLVVQGRCTSREVHKSRGVGPIPSVRMENDLLNAMLDFEVRPGDTAFELPARFLSECSRRTRFVLSWPFH